MPQNYYNMFKTIWFEVIWRNWRKRYKEKENYEVGKTWKKKKTLRAFASRAN